MKFSSHRLYRQVRHPSYISSLLAILKESLIFHFRLPQVALDTQGKARGQIVARKGNLPCYITKPLFRIVPR